jgi:hypothetical protein
MAENKKRKVKLVIVEDSDDEDSVVVDNSMANLLVKLESGGLDTLVLIYRKEFKLGFTNMKASSIPLERRRALIKSGIREEVEKSSDPNALCKKILETYFKTRVFETNWLSKFAVGEEVLVNIACGRSYISMQRLGVIKKINKKSLSIKMYDYETIHDDSLAMTHGIGVLRYVWNKTTIGKTKTTYHESGVIKRGEQPFYDVLFAEGREEVDYMR